MTIGDGTHKFRRCGALPLEGQSVCWRVWAPRAERVELVLVDGDRSRSVPMQSDEPGYFQCEQARVPDGQLYAFKLNGGDPRPDPCSLWQPLDLHGPSAVVRPNRFTWSDQSWQGIPLAKHVIYELHVGTFTPEGTFEAIIPRLASLRELGITALEIMPISPFPGTRNWGYDGVLPYAAQDSYGGPHGFQRLVDACHAAGLAVILDLVYNHFGPEGNYLNEFGPYFTDRYRTPWGTAVNYDGAGSDPVRDYVIDNARMWVEEYHVDGLRLDAVHAIFDLSAKHILQSIEETVQQVAERTGRHIHIIAESDLNDPRLLFPPERGGYGLDAQWSDDFHHAVHACLTGEHQGYYEDFGDPQHVAKVLQNPFLYAGDFSAHRQRKHGAPIGDLTGERFVVSIQNHDQVGNRARGDRFGTLLTPEAQRLAASLLLFAPHLPMIFMGDEYGEKNPFLFFCSFQNPELVAAVRRGRTEEFKAFAWQGEVPDPDAESTFVASRLTWSWPEGTVHAGIRRLYADLLEARREWPALRDFEHRTARLLPNEEHGKLVQLTRGKEQERAVIVFNLSAEPLPFDAQVPTGYQPLFSSNAAKYQGDRNDLSNLRQLQPWECVAFGPPAWKRFV